MKSKPTQSFIQTKLQGTDFPGSSKTLRLVLDLLVVFCVVTQAVAVLLILVGAYGSEAFPVAGGAVISMFLIAWFYTRWLFPMLDAKHVVAIIFMKELATIFILGVIIGLVYAVKSFMTA